MLKQKIKIERERLHKAYAEHWNTSGFFLKQGRADIKGSYYMFLASLSYSAFALEAFLNHIGKGTFECWEDMDRLSPKGKLNAICEKLSVQQDYSSLPWQVVPELIGFRNKSVHAKSQSLKSSKIVTEQDGYENLMHEFLVSDWMEFVTESNASKVRLNLEKIMQSIHEVSTYREDSLFSPGIQSSSATLHNE